MGKEEMKQKASEKMKVELRKTEKKEIPVIAAIYKKEFSKPPYNENWTNEKTINKMNFFIKYYDLYTIKVNKKIVGFICINPTFMCPGEVAFGEEMAIDEKFQGQGIGTWVLQKILEIYKEKGFIRFLGIADSEGKAIKLYNKLGIKLSKKDLLIEKILK